MIVVHQQDAGKGQDDEEIEGDSTHAPGEAVSHGVAIDLGWVKMKKDVAQDAQRSAALCIVVLDPEDRLVELSLLRPLEGLGFLFSLLSQYLGSLAHLREKPRLLLFRADLFLVSHQPPPLLP